MPHSANLLIVLVSLSRDEHGVSGSGLDYSRVYGLFSVRDNAVVFLLASGLYLFYYSHRVLSARVIRGDEDPVAKLGRRSAHGRPLSPVSFSPATKYSYYPSFFL